MQTKSKKIWTNEKWRIKSFHWMGYRKGESKLTKWYKSLHSKKLYKSETCDQCEELAIPYHVTQFLDRVDLAM